jgi:hypothetical protein
MTWLDARTLTETDPDRALAEARADRRPWFRCQALALVARFAPEPVASAAFDEALTAAAAGKDPYQQNAVLAWPIRAAIERGRVDLAETWLRGALAAMPTIKPLASRVAALALLWPAAFPGGPKLRDIVRATVFATCPVDIYWQADKLFRQMADTLRSESEAESDAVIVALAPGKTRTKLENARARGERKSPRPFFPV